QLVEELLDPFPRRQGTGHVHDAVRQGALAVVDVSDDGKVADPGRVDGHDDRKGQARAALREAALAGRALAGRSYSATTEPGNARAQNTPGGSLLALRGLHQAELSWELVRITFEDEIDSLPDEHGDGHLRPLMEKVQRLVLLGRDVD